MIFHSAVSPARSIPSTPTACHRVPSTAFANTLGRRRPLRPAAERQREEQGTSSSTPEERSVSKDEVTTATPFFRTLLD
jgi:hypothetical protein